MPDAMLNRHACVVLGMHRSGTSALAKLLVTLGADPPARPNPPSPDNPEGYFEPAEIIELHDQLLAACDTAWFDLKPFSLEAAAPERLEAITGALAAALAVDYPPATAPFPLIKDPRMCRFFPYARQLLAASGMACSVVMALRHPTEVAASLGRRDQISATYAGLLWAQHVIAAERDSRSVPRVTVSYGAMMADWQGIARRIRRLPGPWGAADLAQSPLRPDLRHHTGLDPVDMFGPRLGPLLDRLHTALAGLADLDDDLQQARIDIAAEDLLEAAGRHEKVMTAEYLFRRLSTPHPFWRSPDSVRDQTALAAIFDDLHQACSRTDDA